MKKSLIWKLALKNIMYTKRKGILISFTIMLAVCLIFNVLTYWNSYNNIKKADIKTKEGEYHAEYMNLSKWQLDKLASNKSIEECYVTEEVRNIKIINEELVDNYIAPRIISFEEVENVWPFYKGKAPNKEDEIVIDKWVMDAMGLELNLNQKIELKFSISDKENNTKKEVSKEFKIVGILDDIESLRANNYSYIIFNNEYISKLTNDIDYNMKVLLKSNFECEQQIKNMATKLGINEDNIIFNVTYIEVYGISILEILKFAIIIMIVILISGMVVFNVYNIYSIQMVKLYGTLKAIGTTDQQLGRFAVCESFILSTVGNFFGIIVGIGTSYFVIPFINKVNNELSQITIDISFDSVITSMIIGYSIVFISAIHPYQKIKRVSAVIAYNYNPINIGKHYRKITEKKVGIKYLICTRILRYRNGVVFNIVSMSLLYILFIISSSILGSMNVDSITNTMLGGDYNIQISDNVSRGENKKDILNVDFLNKIKTLQGIEKSNNIMYDRMLWDTNSAKNYVDLPEEYKELGIGFDDIDSVIYGYDSDFLERNKKYLVDGEIDIKKLETENYVILVDDKITNIKSGDEIYLIDSTGEKITLKVAGIVSNNITYRGYKASGCDIIMHQNLFKKFNLDMRVQRVSITAVNGKEKQLEENLKDLTKMQEDIMVVSYADLNKEFRENKKVLSMVSYAFLFVVGLIVMFNYINTTLTNILSREREIGILQAIGLTYRQQRRLLMIENLFIVGTSCLIGTVLGFPIGYIGFMFFKEQASYATYYFPIKESIVVSLLFILIQIIITKKCNNVLSKQSIIEKIRYKE